MINEYFIEEKVFEGGSQGRKIFIEAIKISLSTKSTTWIGAFKLHKNYLPREDILEALRLLADEEIPLNIILESRLSQSEVKDLTILSEGASLQAFKNTGATILTDLKPYINVHLKILVNTEFAIISTTNYDDIDSDYIKRDFSLITRDHSIVSELNEILEKIKQQEVIKWPYYHIGDMHIGESRLAWGPAHHRMLLKELIEAAQDEIVIYEQSIQDLGILAALEERLKEGVKVRILISEHPFGKHHPNKSLPNLQALAEKGACIRLTGSKIIKEGLPLHIHAKVIIIDAGSLNQTMYLGSANLYEPVLNPEGDHLNLGIITKAQKYISNVYPTFEYDWICHNDTYVNF